MEHLPLLTKRGEVCVYQDGDVVHLSLGYREDPESEHLLSIHKHYIPQLIAALKATENKIGKS